VKIGLREYLNRPFVLDERKSLATFSNKFCWRRAYEP